jgi:hypothetical protein
VRMTPEQARQAAAASIWGRMSDEERALAEALLEEHVQTQMTEPYTDPLGAFKSTAEVATSGEIPIVGPARQTAALRAQHAEMDQPLRMAEAERDRLRAMMLREIQPGEVGPEALQNQAVAQMGRRELLAGWQEQEAALATALLEQGLGPGMEPPIAGQTIRQKLLPPRAEAEQTKFRTAYDAVPETLVLPKVGEEVIDAALKEKLQGYEQRPEAVLEDAVGQLIEDFRAGDPETGGNGVRVAWLDGLRKRAGTELDNLSGGGDKRGYDSINRSLVLSVMEAIEQTEAQGAEASAALQKARGLRFEFGEKFQRGATGNVRARKGLGMRVPTSQVFEQYAVKGSRGTEPMEQYKQIFGKDAEAMSVAEMGMIGKLREKPGIIDAEGNVNGAALQRFISDYSGVFKSLPELKTKLETMAGYAKNLLRVRKAGEVSVKSFQKSALGAFLDKDPDKAIASIMQGGNPVQGVKDLMAQVGDDPVLVAGMRKGILDWIRSGARVTAEGDINYSSFAKTWNNPTVKRALKTAYTPESIKAIEYLLADKASQQATEQIVRKAMQQNSITGLVEAEGKETSTLGAILGAVRARWTGHMRFAYPMQSKIVQTLLDRFGGSRQKRILVEIMDQLVSPEKALLALREPTPQNVDLFAESLLKGMPGAAVGAALSEGDEAMEALTGALSPAQAQAMPVGNQPEDDVMGREDISNTLLDAIAKVESNNNPKAVSKAGAQGMFQIMPKTGKAYGLKDPFNEEEAREVARAILGDEFDRFGSMELALAAYNAGAPRVRRAIKKAGSADWTLVQALLPRETREYVPKVLSQLEG